MELSSEVILDYFLQSSLTIFNSNSNQPKHHLNSRQASSLRDRTRSNVSTSVFKTDDTATLRTSPTFALNETFLFQRWLFTLARRSVLAMRCYSDLANDPLRSEWVKMLNEKRLTQQRSKIRSTALNINNTNNNKEDNEDAQNANAASITFLAQNNQLPGTPSGGLWCKRRTIWRAAHEKTRIELPQAIVSSLTSYEIAQLQHFGAASSQIQQISPLGISLNDANQTFNGMMQDCGVPNFQELFLETKKSTVAAKNVSHQVEGGSVDFCKRVALRWREGSANMKTSNATWSYDTSGVIWRDVVEAVRFVLGCGNSVTSSNNNKNHYESPARFDNRNNLPPPVPTPSTSKILQAQEQRQIQVQQMLLFSSVAPSNPNSLLDSSNESDQERKLSATSIHWIKAIAAVVISVCFGDINDTQVPGSSSLPEITSDLVRDVLTCVLEIVSQPSNSLFHEKCLLTVAAYLEFQNKMFVFDNSNFDDEDPEKLTQIETLKEMILEPLKPSKKIGTVSAPWWWNHEPPFVHVAWSDVDSADLVKIFALAFPTVSLIPGYTQPFEVADRARLESQIHDIRRNHESKETTKNCQEGVQNQQMNHNNIDLFGETLGNTATEILEKKCDDDDDDSNDDGDELLNQVTRNTKSFMMKNCTDVDILHYPLPKFRFQHREQTNNNDDKNNNNFTNGGRRPASSHHSDYVDQVTRRRIERLRRKQQDDKALTAAALMAVPAPSLVSPSLCRLTAAARGHRSDRVILKNLPILPLSQDDEEETAALEISLQKKSQDWVQEQRPKFVVSRPGSAVLSNNNNQDSLFSQNNTLHIRPWIGAQRPPSAAAAAGGGGSEVSKTDHKNTSPTLLPPKKSGPVSSGDNKTVLDAKSKINNLFSQQSRQEQIHNASSTPWCITNALPAVSVANTRNNNKLGSTAAGVVDSSFLLTKNRKQVATPLGNGTRAREKIRARILAEVISQQREFMTNLGK